MKTITVTPSHRFQFHIWGCSLLIQSDIGVRHRVKVELSLQLPHEESFVKVVLQHLKCSVIVNITGLSLFKGASGAVRSLTVRCALIPGTAIRLARKFKYIGFSHGGGGGYFCSSSGVCSTKTVCQSNSGGHPLKPGVSPLRSTTPHSNSMSSMASMYTGNKTVFHRVRIAICDNGTGMKPVSCTLTAGKLDLKRQALLGKFACLAPLASKPVKAFDVFRWIQAIEHS